MTGIPTDALPDQAGKSCPYCRFPIKQGLPVVTCDSCSSTHHDDCWAENKGCAVVGCGGGPIREAQAPPAGKPLPLTEPNPARLQVDIEPTVAARGTVGTGKAIDPWAVSRPLNFGQAVYSGFHNYFRANGRASRSAYWYWSLFAFMAAMLAAIPKTATASNIVVLALAIPGIMIFIRRAHDSGRSGWWAAAFFLPIVGFVVWIWIGVAPTGPDNQWGPGKSIGQGSGPYS